MSAVAQLDNTREFGTAAPAADSIVQVFEREADGWFRDEPPY